MAFAGNMRCAGDCRVRAAVACLACAPCVRAFGLLLMWCTPSRACCVLRPAPSAASSPRPAPPSALRGLALLRSCALALLPLGPASHALTSPPPVLVVTSLPLPLVEISSFTSPNPVPNSPPWALPHPPCKRSAHARHCQKGTCATTSDALPVAGRHALCSSFISRARPERPL